MNVVRVLTERLNTKTFIIMNNDNKEQTRSLLKPLCTVAGVSGYITSVFKKQLLKVCVSFEFPSL